MYVEIAGKFSAVSAAKNIGTRMQNVKLYQQSINTISKKFKTAKKSINYSAMTGILEGAR